MPANTRPLGPMLPSLANEQDLAHALQLPLTALQRYIAAPSRYYKHRIILKKGGGIRNIYLPSKEVKAIQAWILRCILDKMPAHSQATAYKAGASLLHNVLPHRCGRYYFCLDLKNFFASISQKRAAGCFKLYGYRPYAANMLARLCCCRSRLPQGGVASPALSNAVCYGMDTRLQHIAKACGLVYTRYADDMTFSSRRPISQSARRQICSAIRMHGFVINQEKTRLRSLGNRVKITGLTRHAAQPVFGLGRDRKRALRAALFQLYANTAMPAAERAQRRAGLQGWLAFAKSVDRAAFNQLEAYRQRLAAKYGPPVF